MYSRIKWCYLPIALILSYIRTDVSLTRIIMQFLVEASNQLVEYKSISGKLYIP
jgi:hypothetical protein